MGFGSATYSRCSCQSCGNHYATVFGTDEELGQEPCPSCGKKTLKIVGPLSEQEISSIFYSGG